MPLGLAILALFAVEFLAITTSLQVGLIPAIIISIVVYFIAQDREKILHAKLDNPPIENYDLPLPQAYATIKMTLKTFRDLDRKWNIVHDEKHNYSIMAISEWRDNSWRDHRNLVPDGSLFRQIILQVVLQRNNNTVLTEISMNWKIHSPLTRMDCNELQQQTTEAIRFALKDIESNRTNFATDYESTDEV